MAKLTDAKKNNIIAKWKTGVYTQREIAKSYKVDVAVINRIVKEISKENADIVEAGLIVERAKKSMKNQQETIAIDNAIKYRLEKEFNNDNNKIKIFDATADIIKGVHDLIKKGKSQKVVTSKMGSDVISIDLQAIDYKNAIDTIDKAGQTLGVIDRFARSSDINLTNAQQNNTPTQITIIRDN